MASSATFFARPAARTCAFACVIAALLLGSASARIDKVKLNHDDRGLILVAEPFGFNENGVIEIEIGESTVYLPETKTSVDKSEIGFVLATDAIDVDFTASASDVDCMLHSSDVSKLFTLQEVEENRAPDGNFYYKNSIAEGNGGIYSLYFANCVYESDVTMKVVTSLYNALPNGGRDYLSAGKKLMPSVYLVMFIFSLCMLGMWSTVLAKRKNHVVSSQTTMRAANAFVLARIPIRTDERTDRPSPMPVTPKVLDSVVFNPKTLVVLFSWTTRNNQSKNNCYGH